jgi:hypothetical protein
LVVVSQFIINQCETIARRRCAQKKTIRRSMASTILFAGLHVSPGRLRLSSIESHLLDLGRTTVNEKFDTVDKA